MSESPGRVLALDYGTVRIGLALSDPGRQFSSPYENYTRVNPARDLDYLRRVIEFERVVQLVVGLPIHLDGRESAKSGEARRFAAWLRQGTGLPVAFVDERFSSVEAEHFLLAANLTRQQRKQRRDKLAAHFLLTAYLEQGPLPDSDVGQPIDG